MNRSLKRLGIIVLLLLSSSLSIGSVRAKKHSMLRACFLKQSLQTDGKAIRLSFRATQNALYHDLEPWKVTHIATFGRVESGPSSFFQFDSIKTRKGRIISSRTQLVGRTMYQQDEGDTAVEPVSEATYNEQFIASCRYTPQLLINYAMQSAKGVVEVSSKSLMRYRFALGKSKIELNIRRSDTLLESISILSPHDLYGDVTTSFAYSDFGTTDGVCVPRLIEASTINGKLIDTITVASVTIIPKPTPIFAITPDYKFIAEHVKSPEIVLESNDPHLHIFGLIHTDDKALVVEFKNFILVAEAPLKSANGELIIQEIRKLAPTKPIKYFVFGHHHPHYIGGIRAFVHAGATVLTTPPVMDYVKYLTQAPHTLEPDSLQQDPKPLKVEDIRDSATITDGEFVMKIYHIGNKSHHTNDYLVYYFPSEKLLFEDDLVWIKNNAPVTKAGDSQRGLYEAIKDLGLDVTTVIQSWPVGSKYNVKTEIPFSDLEKSVELK